MEYAAIILFAIATCVTPGPNNTMILTSGLNHGIRGSLPHYFGIVLGFSAMVLGVGLGLAGLFNQIPYLHTALKLIGAVYLSYLSYKIATAPVDGQIKAGAKPFTFVQAAAFQWVNPKAWVLAVGATATYTVANDSYGLQVLIISFIFLVFGSPCIMLWLWFGSELKRFLQKTSSVKLFNISMALLLMSSLIPVFMDLFVGIGQ